LPTAPGRGTQIYTPSSISLTGAQADLWKLEFVGRGGYVTSEQSTPGASGSVSTLTDTVVSATWTYLAIGGVQPFVSLNTNIPTGKSVLLGNATFARMDPDLVDIATFGEGWNYGATVGANFPVTDTIIFSAGVGHTVRGRYDRDTVAGLPNTSTIAVEPGDTTTVNAGLGIGGGPLSGRVSASYSHEGATSFKGIKSFQLGDRYFVSGSGAYAWSASSVSSLVASWSYAQKNKGIIPPFGNEAMNSNSNVYRVRLGHLFVVGNWAAGPIASWLLRDNNAYEPPAFQFVPAKTRWTAGGSLRAKANNNVLLYVNGEHLWIDEDQRFHPGVNALPTPALRYTGWMIAGGASLQF
jgi:hypothetical protein